MMWWSSSIVDNAQLENFFSSPLYNDFFLKKICDCFLNLQIELYLLVDSIREQARVGV